MARPKNALDTPPKRQSAKVFMSGRSQAVRLPQEFRFACDEVAIRREGNSLILSPLYKDWDDYRANAPKASGDFVDAVLRRREDEPPLEEREAFD